MTSIRQRLSVCQISFVRCEVCRKSCEDKDCACNKPNILIVGALLTLNCCYLTVAQFIPVFVSSICVCIRRDKNRRAHFSPVFGSIKLNKVSIAAGQVTKGANHTNHTTWKHGDLVVLNQMPKVKSRANPTNF